MTASSLAAFDDQARLARAALFGDVVIISGQNYIASVVLSGDSIQSDVGGPTPVRTLSAEIAKSDLGSPPIKGTGITHDGVTYTLLEVHGHEGTHRAWLLRAYRKL